MNSVHSIACGLPFFQNTVGRQTHFSIGLRITAIALGTILAIGGILVLCGIPGISQLGNTVAWVTLPIGGALALLGISFKCIGHKSENSTHESVLSKKETLSSEEKASSLHESGSQEKITLSKQTIDALKSCLDNVLENKEAGVKLYNSRAAHRVFELEGVPDLIFKVSLFAGQMRARYQNILKGQTICDTHKLGLLVIPKAELFTVQIDGREYDVLVEQKLDINPVESIQEHYYEEYADSLDEAIRQLALFICHSDYQDVEWRNNPVLNNSLDQQGNRKLGLIDLEGLGSAFVGLFGEEGGARGLVRCVNERQGLIVKQIADTHKIHYSMGVFERVHRKRKEELEEGRQLKNYYTQKQIVQGNEPITIDINTLDFSLYQPDQQQKLRTLAIHVANKINEAIASSPQQTIKGRRFIDFNVNDDQTLLQGHNTLIESVEDIGSLADDEYYLSTYLGYVLFQFVEEGLIFKTVLRKHRGYFIQA